MTPGLFTESDELEHCVPYVAVIRKKSIPGFPIQSQCAWQFSELLIRATITVKVLSTKDRYQKSGQCSQAD